MKSDRATGNEVTEPELDLSAAGIEAVTTRLGADLEDDGCEFEAVRERPFERLKQYVEDRDFIKVSDKVNDSMIQHEDPVEYIEWKLEEDDVPGPLYEADSGKHPDPWNSGLEDLFEHLVYFAAEDSYQEPDSSDGESRSDIYTLGVTEPEESEGVYLMRMSPNEAFKGDGF